MVLIYANENAKRKKMNEEHIFNVECALLLTLNKVDRQLDRKLTLAELNEAIKKVQKAIKTAKNRN